MSKKRRFFVERSIYVQKCWNLVLRYIAERRARNENPRIFWFLRRGSRMYVCNIEQSFKTGYVTVATVRGAYGREDPESEP